MDAPPDDLPRYRLLTGPDDAAFCRRVSEALGLGYQLYGSPVMTHDGTTVIVGQALIWPVVEGPGVPQASRRVGFMGL
jgi:hypothetical protein